MNLCLTLELESFSLGGKNCFLDEVLGNRICKVLYRFSYSAVSADSLWPHGLQTGIGFPIYHQLPPKSLYVYIYIYIYIYIFFFFLDSFPLMVITENWVEFPAKQ